VWSSSMQILLFGYYQQNHCKMKLGYIFLYYISLPSILAQNMRFEFLIAASFRLFVFWNVMPSDLVITYQHFWEVTWGQRNWEFWYLSIKLCDVMARNFFPNLFVVPFWFVSHFHCFPYVMCFVSQFLLCKSYFMYCCPLKCIKFVHLCIIYIYKNIGEDNFRSYV